MALKKFDPNPQSGQQSSADSSKKRSVLYVEDDDGVWEVAEFALRGEFVLTRARNGVEAFAQLASHRYDIIMMDIELQGSDLNGIEICQILKSRYHDTIPDYARGITLGETPIIFVTAYKSRYGKPELLEAGGDDRITKPVDYARLSFAMSRLLLRSIISK